MEFSLASIDLLSNRRPLSNATKILYCDQIKNWANFGIVSRLWQMKACKFLIYDDKIIIWDLLTCHGCIRFRYMWWRFNVLIYDEDGLLSRVSGWHFHDKLVAIFLEQQSHNDGFCSLLRFLIESGRVLHFKSAYYEFPLNWSDSFCHSTCTWDV